MAIKNGFKARFVKCGEGYNGDYDKNDPEDRELLRLDIIRVENGEEFQDQDMSYCTSVPVDTPKEERRRLLKAAVKLMAKARDEGKVSLKRQAEKLSWMEPGMSVSKLTERPET